MKKAVPVAFILAAAFLIASTGVSSPIAHALPSQDLARQYAPVLQFAAGEKFFPTSVGYVVSSSTLDLRNPDGTLTVVDSAPTPQSLGTGGDNSSSQFLNNKQGTLDGIAADYSATGAALGFFAYVHILNGSSGVAIQYWFFYSYNNGLLNDHQSDIEVITLLFDGSGAPQSVIYSQHLAGETAVWSDVETRSGHPVVYVALGSHANYFRPYQGKIGIENDVVDSNGKTIEPSQLNLVFLHDSGGRPADQNWLAFPGRWGFTGTDTEVATGMAGPLGPVYNDPVNGVGQRWSDPSGYSGRTLNVSNNYVGVSYFNLAWIAANLVLLFLIYVGIRALIKVVGIIRLQRKGGLRVGRFLRSRGGAGLALGLLGVALTFAALFLPWYTVTASSQSGPLAATAPVQLLIVNGIQGVQVNLFTGPNADSTSGLTNFASASIPFAYFFALGLGLLLLDIVGVKSGKTLGRKFIFGAITLLLPLVFIYAFILYLPNLLPLAASLFGGQSVPAGAVQLVDAVASNPISGTASQTFPVVGSTVVNWGYGLGAYMFIAAAVVRVVAGFVMRSAPSLEKPSVMPGPSPADGPQPTTP